MKKSGVPVTGGTVHPAWHGNARADGHEIPTLFPRARPAHKDDGSRATERAERLAAMARHPAGKDIATAGDPRCGSSHEVADGDSLWDISAAALDTDDDPRIASYWPEVYEANQEVIGDDPALIRPGQTLDLPRCE